MEKHGEKTAVLGHNGAVIEEANHETLMRLGGKYAEMFNLQAERYKKQ